MSIEEITTTEPSLVSRDSLYVETPSRAFSTFEDSNGGATLQESPIGKALSAHFKLYPDLYSKREL